MITLAWADMEKYDERLDVFSDYYIPGNENLSLRMTFSTPQEIGDMWEEISNNPKSMWYWLLDDDGELVVSGSCDPRDYDEIIAPYFGIEDCEVE